jgi:hypothetical protein
MSESESSIMQLYTPLATIMAATIASSSSPSTTPETVRPVCMQSYSNSNNNDDDDSTPTPISTSSTSLFSSGRLHNIEQNHIIIYPGAFNPPHLAHLLIMHSALHSQLPGLRPIAIIIALRNDQYLEHKNEQGSESFLISQRDRAELWHHHHHHHHHQQPDHKAAIWIYAAEESITLDFSQRLMDKAQGHGIRIALVQLRGTENLSALHPPPLSRIRVAELVTDVGRRSEDFCRERRRQLPGYSVWERVERGGGGGGGGGGEGEQGQVEAWYCYRIGQPAFRVYLLLSGQEGELVSSTRLRQLLRQKSGLEMVQELRTMALSPMRLARMLQAGRVRLDEDLMLKLRDDVELQGLTDLG